MLMLLCVLSAIEPHSWAWKTGDRAARMHACTLKLLYLPTTTVKSDLKPPFRRLWRSLLSSKGGTIDKPSSFSSVISTVHLITRQSSLRHPDAAKSALLTNLSVPEL